MQFDLEWTDTLLVLINLIMRTATMSPDRSLTELVCSWLPMLQLTLLIFRISDDTIEVFWVHNVHQLTTNSLVLNLSSSACARASS